MDRHGSDDVVAMRCLDEVHIIDSMLDSSKTLYEEKNWDSFSWIGSTSLVISIRTNLNATVYDDILQNCVIVILYQQFGQDPFLFQHDNGPVHKAQLKKKGLIQSDVEEELD